MTTSLCAAEFTHHERPSSMNPAPLSSAAPLVSLKLENSFSSEDLEMLLGDLSLLETDCIYLTNVGANGNFIASQLDESYTHFYSSPEQNGSLIAAKAAINPNAVTTAHPYTLPIELETQNGSLHAHLTPFGDFLVADGSFEAKVRAKKNSEGEESLSGSCNVNWNCETEDGEVSFSSSSSIDTGGTWSQESEISYKSDDSEWEISGSLSAERDLNTGETEASGEVSLKRKF